MALVSSVMKITYSGRKSWAYFRSLLPEILPKFTNEKLKSTWKAAEKETSGLTESYIPNRPSSRSGRKDCWINKYGVQNGASIIQW